jgi:hypothetical protein
MRRISALAALTALVVAGLSLGCKDKPPPPAPAVAAADTAAPTANVAAPTPSGSAAAPGRMANCPTLVEGGATAIKDIEGGVELTVTAKEEAAIKEIRARARHLAEVSREEAPSGRHNGSGHGGGKSGRCPVITRNTVVTTEDVEGGARITVKPRDVAELDWVRREARERQADPAQPGGRKAKPPAEGASPGPTAPAPTAPVETGGKKVKQPADALPSGPMAPAPTM